jgi:hypothetical protein
MTDGSESEVDFGSMNFSAVLTANSNFDSIGKAFESMLRYDSRQAKKGIWVG